MKAERLYPNINWNQLIDDKPISVMQQIQKRVATEMAEKWESIVKDIFLRKTGEELTMENIDRLQIGKVNGDPNEYYMIDGKLAITQYPLDMKMPVADEVYKFTMSRNYREHE